MRNKTLWILIALLVFGITACSHGGLGQQTSRAPDPTGQLPTGVKPVSYHLLVITDPASDSFSGSVTIAVQLDSPHKQIWLHSKDQTIERALVRHESGQLYSVNVRKSHADDGLISLNFEEAVAAGNSEIEITYTAPYNQTLVGLYKTTQNGKPYLSTQMEAVDARRFVPSFDEPRFKTPWTLRVRAPDGQNVITNAPLVSLVVNADGWVEHQFATTRAIQSYLLALAVGPYDMRDGGELPPNDIRTRPLDFRAFAPAGKASKLKPVMDITEEMLAWQEAYFDYPYPYAKLDLIAVPDFAYGAMENAGAIIYRESRLLLDERTSLVERRRSLVTHAHELGHMWFGNLVTPVWWNDIWLNEAFATWISYKTMDAVYPETGYDLEPQIGAVSVMDADSLVNARQIRNPILRNADIVDAFDGITYRKGGGVLAMFESYLGEEAFREGMRLHMRRYEDGVADVNDFMQSLADGSGNPAIVDSFRSFIFQPGIPNLDISLACDAGNQGTLSIKQSRYAPLGSEIEAHSTWTIPFAARVHSAGGTVEIRQILTEETTQIELEQGCADWVIPNANGSGYWRFSLEESHWNALLANYDDLTDGEQLALADSLTAAYSAGRLTESILIEGLSIISNGFWAGAVDSLSQVPSYFGVLENEDDKSQFRHFLTRTFGNRYQQLESVPEDQLSEGNRLLKIYLNQILLEYGELDEEREQLAEAAISFLGVEGSPDPNALDADNIEAGIASAARLGDQAFYTTAIDFALNSDNQGERRLVLNSLAKHLPESQLLDLMERVQGDDYQGQETWSVSVTALENRNAQSSAWKKFKADFETIAARTPELRKRQLAGSVASFCEPDLIAEAVNFFHSHADLMPGYERSLAQGQESAKLCAAFRQEKGSAVAAAFAPQ